MRAVYERIRGGRPGMLDRPGPWWDDRLYDPESQRKGAQPLQALVVPDGYALYAVRPDRDDQGPAGEVAIRELAAVDAGGARPAVGLPARSGPDADRRLAAGPARRAAVADAHRSRRRAHRPRDRRSGCASSTSPARSPRAATTDDPDVVLEVADAFCPWNAGRYRLAGGGCERTDAEPDLALDAAALGAAYLGGTTLGELAGAGRVAELRPGALAARVGGLPRRRRAVVPEIF